MVTWESSVPPKLRNRKKAEGSWEQERKGGAQRGQRDRGGAGSAEPGAGQPGEPAAQSAGAPAGVRGGQPPNSYAVKYFGVAHGQLGVLTRRKYLRGGPSSGGGASRGAEPAKPLDGGGDVPAEGSGAAGSLQGSAASTEDMMKVVEDGVGGIWVPGGAVYGKQLKSFKKSPSDKGRSSPSLVPDSHLPRPAQYQSHNALAGWMLSPVRQPPMFIPGNPHAIRAATPPQRNMRVAGRETPSSGGGAGGLSVNDPALNIGRPPSAYAKG